MCNSNDALLINLQAFIHAVSSSVCGVHEQSLMLAVRTTYNIFLISKNQINQTTAKATLSQMLSIIFARLEHSSVIEYICNRWCNPRSAHGWLCRRTVLIQHLALASSQTGISGVDPTWQLLFLLLLLLLSPQRQSRRSSTIGSRRCPR